eukprot:11675997-Alexandrium_andersonii.AAC.1
MFDISPYRVGANGNNVIGGMSTVMGNLTQHAKHAIVDGLGVGGNMNRPRTHDRKSHPHRFGPSGIGNGAKQGEPTPPRAQRTAPNHVGNIRITKLLHVGLINIHEHSRSASPQMSM